MFSPVIFGRISNVVLVSFLSFLIITVDLFVNHASMDICAVMPGNLLTVGFRFVHITKNFDADTFCSARIIHCLITIFFGVLLQSLTLKEKVNPLKNFKEKASEEGPSYKNLLLSMVRLIHANPLLMLNVTSFF
jgi:hypothetical protein